MPQKDFNVTSWETLRGWSWQVSVFHPGDKFRTTIASAKKPQKSAEGAALAAAVAIKKYQAKQR